MRSRGIRLGVLVVVVSLVAAACDGGSAEDTTTTTAAATTSIATTTVPPTTLPTVTATATTDAEAGSSTDDGEAVPVSCEEPVKVGVITDQSGPQAIYGAHVMRGFPLGMEYAVGDPGDKDRYTLDDCEIEVFYRDDASDAEAAAAATLDLIEGDDVDVIVGSVDSDATTGIQEIAFESGVIHIAVPAAGTDLTGATFNHNSFRTSRNNYQDAINMCRYLPGSYSTYVQLAPDTSFGHGGAEAFRDACTFFGGTFVADDIFAPADTVDFSVYMEEVLASEADAFLVTWAGGGLVPLVQAARDQGVLDTMAFATSFVDNQLMPILFAEGLGTTSGIPYHYTLPDNPINDWLVERTEAEFGKPPDLFDADAFNAALLITEALKVTGGDAGEDDLRDAMEGLSFEGPKGLVEIRAEDHVALQNMYIVTLTSIDTPDSRFFELVTTNRPHPPCSLEGEYAGRCGDLRPGALLPPPPVVEEESDS